jgi:hypothetical protein
MGKLPVLECKYSGMKPGAMLVNVYVCILIPCCDNKSKSDLVLVYRIRNRESSGFIEDIRGYERYREVVKEVEAVCK